MRILAFSLILPREAGRGRTQDPTQCGIVAPLLPISASFASCQLVRGCHLRHQSFSEILSDHIQPASLVPSRQGGGGQNSVVDGFSAAHPRRCRLLGTAWESGNRHRADDKLPAHEPLPQLPSSACRLSPWEHVSVSGLRLFAFGIPKRADQGAASAPSASTRRCCDVVTTPLLSAPHNIDRMGP